MIMCLLMASCIHWAMHRCKPLRRLLYCFIVDKSRTACHMLQLLRHGNMHVAVMGRSRREPAG